MRIDEEMHSLAARFAHELAGPWGAVGQAHELICQKFESLLTTDEQKFLKAGIEANLTPAGTIRSFILPLKRKLKLADPLAHKLAMAIGKNPRLQALTNGKSARTLERCLKIFDIGFACKCARLGFVSGQETIRNLRALGDFTRADLLQKTSVIDTLHIAWMLNGGKRLSICWKFQRLPMITANAQALTQVWSNLFSNAAQINPDGCLITVSARKTGSRIVVEVANTGACLPKGLKIFEKGATRRKGGRGLGLHMCKQIVASHRGKISARNADDMNGAIFTVELPTK